VTRPSREKVLLSPRKKGNGLDGGRPPATADTRGCEVTRFDELNVLSLLVWCLSPPVAVSSSGDLANSRVVLVESSKDGGQASPGRNMGVAHQHAKPISPSQLPGKASLALQEGGPWIDLESFSTVCREGIGKSAHGPAKRWCNPRDVVFRSHQPPRERPAPTSLWTALGGRSSFDSSPAIP
jgi:hypothetical protein